MTFLLFVSIVSDLLIWLQIFLAVIYGRAVKAFNRSGANKVVAVFESNTVAL